MKTTYRGGHYRPLCQNDINAIHAASMQVLEESGFRVDNQRALELFEAKGAQVDFAKKVVRTEQSWVMNHLKMAPARITLYGRDEAHNMVAEADNVYYGTGGTALQIMDRHTGIRRPTNAGDVADLAILTDALPHIDWYCLPVYPNELSKEEADVARFYNGLKYTGKHVMGGIYGSHDGAREVIRLAQAVAGGEENLRKKPIISVICSTISPFTFETRYVDFIFDLCEAGIPIATSCAPIAGATSPMTLAGTLVQVNAEAICGILLTQLIKPGSPVLYSTVPTTANMKTMDFLFGPVENGIMNAACAQMASYYNVPMYSTGGVTESKQLDIQNGYEKCINNLLPGMAGGQLIHNAAGLIDSSMTVAFEQYVIDNDIIGMAKRVLEGIRITEDTLAVKEICAAGPGGHYLATEHTVRNMHSELFVPQVAVRMNRGSWERDGSHSAVERACRIADEIIDNHQPFPMPNQAEIEILSKSPKLGLNHRITQKQIR